MSKTEEELKAEEELILKARNGDEKSLESLLEIYKPIVNSITRRCFLVGGEQEDLVQEGTVGLFKAIMTYDKNKNTLFSTYARSCIRNEILGEIRRSQEDKNKLLNDYVSLDEQDEDEDELYIFVPDPNGENPEILFLKKEREREIIEKVKSYLSDFEFKVWYYYKQYGFSYTEIASMLKKDSKSVDNALNRSYKKIQAAYKDGELCI